MCENTHFLQCFSIAHADKLVGYTVSHPDSDKYTDMYQCMNV